MRAVELFCGGGLMALGLVQASCKLVGACDVWDRAVQCFNNQTVLPAIGSVASVSDYRAIEAVDLVSGGTVCKAFSAFSSVHGTNGDKDSRNTFPLYIDYVQRSRPRSIILETSFKTKKFFPYFWQVLGKLKSMGYHITAHEIDAYNFGVPQHRQRVVIIGSKEKKRDFPIYVRRKCDPRVIGDCLYDAPKWDTHPLYRTLSEAGDRFYRDCAAKANSWNRPRQETEPSHTILSSCGWPNGVFRRGGRLYEMGPRLAARIQGLPDEYRLPTYSFNIGLRIIGNGLPPQVSKHLVEALL